MNLISNNKMYGYFSVLCDENTPEMMSAVKLIGSACTIALQKEYLHVPASEDYQTMFLKYLFDEKQINREQLKNWELYLPIPIAGPYYVGYCSGSIKKESREPIDFIHAVIKKAYPSMLFFVKNKDLVFLFTSMKSEEYVCSAIKMLQDAFRSYKPRFGVSNQFFNLEKPNIYLKQAKYACTMAGTKKRDYLAYRDCVLDQMITNLYAGMPRESYIHESVDQLRRYDEENNTEYLKTLNVYVKSLFNAKITTEKYLIHMAKKYGVDIKMNCEATEQVIKEMQADVVILATGATPAIPPIKGIDGVNVVQANDVLDGKAFLAKPFSNVLILGGGLVGAETADFLGEHQHHVWIIDMLPEIGMNFVPSIKTFLKERYKQYGVREITNSMVKEICENSITYEQNGEVKELSNIDTVVIASGSKAYNPLEVKLQGSVKELYVIGDAKKVRLALDAIEEGARIALAI